MVFNEHLQARTDMEQQTIEGASTSDAVGFITVVQSLKRKLKNWEKNVEVRKTWITGNILSLLM